MCLAAKKNKQCYSANSNGSYMYISTVESNVLCVLSTTKENVKKGRITYLTVPILDKLNISKSEQS